MVGDKGLRHGTDTTTRYYNSPSLLIPPEESGRKAPGNLVGNPDQMFTLLSKRETPHATLIVGRFFTTVQFWYSYKVIITLEIYILSRQHYYSSVSWLCWPVLGKKVNCHLMEINDYKDVIGNF